MEDKETNKNLKILAKSATIVLIGVLFSKFFTYIYRVVVARSFGPETYGTYSLAINILSLFIAISLLGFDNGLIRFVSMSRGKKDPKNEIKHLLKFVFKISFTLSILLGISLFLLAEKISLNIFNDPSLVFFLQVFSALIPIGVLTAFFLSVLNAYEKINWYSFIENISKSSLNILFLAIFIVLGFKSDSIVYSYLFKGLAVLFLTYIIFRKHIPLRKTKTLLNQKEINDLNKSFTSYSIPLLFFTVTMFAFSWVDSFSLGYLKNSSAVGFYNAAVPIALLLNIAPQLFLKLFLPIISREYAKERFNTIKDLSKQVGKWIFMINIPLFSLIFLFPGSFINLFFGKEYLVAETALRFLSLSAILFSVFRVSNRLIAMIGKTKRLFTDTIIALILNLVLNAILIPMPSIFGIDNSIGINGAAIATTTSTTFLGLLFLFRAKKQMSIIPLKRKMINLLFSAFVASALTLFLRGLLPRSTTTFILLSLFLVLVYLFLALVFKGLDKYDLMVLKLLKRK
tara:strand:- start:2405 stop:3946 length:1542 start_codon:yes stop_codon:yes gene_type:complete